MAELVDALDLGSSTYACAGSSPARPTIFRRDPAVFPATAEIFGQAHRRIRLFRTGKLGQGRRPSQVRGVSAKAVPLPFLIGAT